MLDAPQQESEIGAGLRRRFRRAGLMAGALSTLGIALTACGGGSPSPGVARLSTSTSDRSSANAGGSSSKESTASAQEQGVAYAQCMRTHGVPDFPDPTSSGGNDKQVVIRVFKEAGNAQAEAAQTACRHLLPSGGQPTRAEIARHVSAFLGFARCMRTHGLSNFPDPTSSGEVTHEMLAKAGIDVHQPAVLQAADACVSVTHGILTKAAVARFAAGH